MKSRLIAAAMGIHRNTHTRRRMENDAINALIEQLASGAFESLLGANENEQLECKDQPYDLTKENQKLELAKDVSAFANSGGGILVIGAKSEKQTDRAVEVVVSISPFDSALFSAQQYHAVIEGNTWPNPRGLDIKWCPASKDSSRGLAYIHVPPQDASDEPFLVRKALDEGGSIRGNMLGFYERYRDKVAHKEAKDFHYLIRAGRTARGIEDRLASIESRLSEQYSDDLLPLNAIDTQLIVGRVSGLVFATSLQGRPSFALSGYFVGPVTIPQIFATRDSPVANLLKNPPQFRPAGFGIDAGGSVNVVEGSRLQSLLVEDNRALELWRDGTTIFVAAGDQQFLCWGRYASPPLVINPIVLIESICEFCMLMKQLQKLVRPENCGVQIRVHLRTKVDGQDLSLGPGPVGRYSRYRMEARSAPQPSVEVEAQWVKGDIDVGLLALDLVAKLYSWFGLTLDEVPYTTGISDDRRIDLEQLQQLSSD